MSSNHQSSSYAVVLYLGLDGTEATSEEQNQELSNHIKSILNLNRLNLFSSSELENISLDSKRDRKISLDRLAGKRTQELDKWSKQYPNEKVTLLLSRFAPFEHLESLELMEQLLNDNRLDDILFADLPNFNKDDLSAFALVYRNRIKREQAHSRQRREGKTKNNRQGDHLSNPENRDKMVCKKRLQQWYLNNHNKDSLKKLIKILQDEWISGVDQTLEHQALLLNSQDSTTSRGNVHGAKSVQRLKKQLKELLLSYRPRRSFLLLAGDTGGKEDVQDAGFREQIGTAVTNITPEGLTSRNTKEIIKSGKKPVSGVIPNSSIGQETLQRLPVNFAKNDNLPDFDSPFELSIPADLAREMGDYLLVRLQNNWESRDKSYFVSKFYRWNEQAVLKDGQSVLSIDPVSGRAPFFFPGVYLLSVYEDPEQPKKSYITYHRMLTLFREAYDLKMSSPLFDKLKRHGKL
ncbi:MAG: hypothetical protein AAF741_13160 [Bacteroidota bacterium]